MSLYRRMLVAVVYRDVEADDVQDVDEQTKDLCLDNLVVSEWIADHIYLAVGKDKKGEIIWQLAPECVQTSLFEEQSLWLKTGRPTFPLSGGHS